MWYNSSYNILLKWYSLPNARQNSHKPMSNQNKINQDIIACNVIGQLHPRLKRLLLLWDIQK